jgi:phosphoribosylamine---glycine ligase
VKVLVVGSGAREHALALALLRDPAVSAVVVAPGNAGIAMTTLTLAVDATDPEAVVGLALSEGVDLVVIGPEAPLVAGVADRVRSAGIACFGPSAAAAQLEGSKTFAKDVMAAAGVPTARSTTFTTLATALADLEMRSAPYVIKADGLAAGKGVTVTSDLALAQAAVRDGLSEPGAQVLIEDFLDGPEVSLFAISDGVTVRPLLPAQDFKRVGDGDTGPNTGGMGAYAPLPWLTADVDGLCRMMVEPTVAALARRGTPFVGLVYAGLAMTADGPRIVEYNARFGDPETQVVLALLDSPLGQLLHAAATGTLAGLPAPRFAAGSAVTVVLAAPGYPAAPMTGGELRGLDDASRVPGVTVLHAGTRRDGSTLQASGGRVLSVTAVGPTLADARERAYAAVDRIKFEGAVVRRDIAAAACEGRAR